MRSNLQKGVIVMKIKMLGIDHTCATVNDRERFSFTKSGCSKALNKLKEDKNVSGALIISTCNRMEIWVSYTDREPDLKTFISNEKAIPLSEIDKFVVERSSEEAVRHLFFVTGGLKSLILGDDQILTQLKDALVFSREEGCTDSLIEVLFRMAITAGKKVRTEVNFDRGNRSAAVLSVSYLQQHGRTFSDKKCLVIGNGEMGKLAAQTLIEAGADVTVTIRQYRSGNLCVMEGCERINYGDRYEIIPECDYVFSATSSPNLTITKERLSQIKLKKEVTFVDLAVPRDIESDIKQIEGVSLYDIDDLKIDEKSSRMISQRRQAEEILEHEIKAFLAEQSGRNHLNKIKNVGCFAGEEAAWRTKKQINKLSISDKEKDMVYQTVKSNTDKVTQKLLFSLQKELSPGEFAHCMKILENKG